MSDIPPTDHAPSSPALTDPFASSAHSEPTGIPVALTSFVGREHEIELVPALLRRPDVRLLTLTGPGGIGKTRLALKVIEGVRDTFADGVTFVPLASVRDPDLVLPTVAHFLDVPDVASQAPVARLQAFLADRHLLLVLDNIEHLLDVVAPLVAGVLVSCPRVTVVGTSRARLGISGEQVVPLGALSTEEARALFAARARAAVPSFAIIAETAPVIDAICSRLDRLPLAIELAAARVNVLPPRALLARLEHRLDLLTDGPRDAPTRMRDMRAAIAWSHDLLTDQEQVLFRRLGVFVGGFTLEAAQAITGESRDVLNDVSALVAASLVNPMQGVADEPRFTMLETIREYALEQLEVSGEAEAARARHTAYFLTMSEGAKHEVVSPKHRALGARLEAEHDNLRSVFERATGRGDVDTAQRLAAAVGVYFWIVRGYLAEGRHWADRARSLGICTQPGVYAELLFAASEVAGISGHPEQAVTLAEEALSRARATGDDHTIGRALLHLANAVGNCGAGDPVPLYEEALVLLDTPAGWTQSSPVLYNLAIFLLEQRGDVDRSKALASEALVRWREADIPWGVARALSLLADIARRQCDRTQATALNRQALTLNWEMGDKMGLVQLLLAIAGAASADRDQATAVARLAGAADTLAEESGFVLWQDYRDLVEHDMEASRVTLGEEAFTEARAAGRALPVEEAVSLALAVNDAIGAPVATVVRGGLTQREREVLALLVDGRSDREIAESLGISYRTVTSYVRNILDKFDVTSRTAAATLAVRRGLI